jgi:hypothetical protein
LVTVSYGRGVTHIIESWGLNLTGAGLQPVKIRNASLLVGYESTQQDFGQGNAYISGNVGIGTSSTGAKLEVNGTLLTAGGSSNLDGLNLNYLANSGKTLIGWNRSRGEGESDFISNQGAGGIGGFAFYNYDNSNQERQLMWVRGDGAVYIGGNSAQGSLQVNGNIHTREVRVDTQNFPDFVFKPAYALPSLKEVKNFIDRKGHLPGMPSEAEAVKEGISLGEMNKKLVQKVEELTLYVIAQNEHLNQQEKKINQLSHKKINK